MDDKIILLVEDNPQDELLILRALRKAHVANRIDVVRDGQQALDLLLNPEGVRPDIVISDIEMPRLDGYTLTRRIRETPALAHLPVILFSSLITDELRHKGQSVGADEQISKPQFGDLARLAMELIEKRRTLAD